MTARPMLDPQARTPFAARAQVEFNPDIVQEVATAVARDDVVVVGMAQNPVVKQARKALDAAGVTFTYLEYGSYLSQWRRRLAIKLWSGWPTFPQIFVKGVLVGGNKELQGAMERGELQRWIAEGPPRVQA